MWGGGEKEDYIYGTTKRNGTEGPQKTAKEEKKKKHHHQ